MTREGERGFHFCFRDAVRNVNSEGLCALLTIWKVILIDLEGIFFRECTFGMETRHCQSGRGERIRDREDNRGLHDPCRDDRRQSNRDFQDAPEMVNWKHRERVTARVSRGEWTLERETGPSIMLAQTVPANDSWARWRYFTLGTTQPRRRSHAKERWCRWDTVITLWDIV